MTSHRCFRVHLSASLLLAGACSEPVDRKSEDATSSADSTGTSSRPGTTGNVTTSLSGASTGNETTAGEETGSFLQMPDGGGGANQCDVWAQDCPLGEKCMPFDSDGDWSWDAAKCSPVAASPKQPGDDCTVEGNDVSGIDDCDTGSMCFSVDPQSLIGTCVSFCEGSAGTPTCSDPDTKCHVGGNDGVMPLCLHVCHPLSQDCPQGAHQPQGCYPSVAGDFLCWPDFSFDGGTYGDPCMFYNVCDPGLFCADGAVVPGCPSSGCCSPYCDLASPDPNASCPGVADGQECVSFHEQGMVPPGYEDVGICALP